MSCSAQERKDVSQAFEEEKEKLDEVMKDAKRNMVAKNEISRAMSSDDQISAMAVCDLRSGVRYQSRYYISHSWTGDFMTRMPEFINSGDGATIVHKGSKGAVLYGLLPDNPRSAAWLLAWSKPEDPNQPNRVLVLGGTIQKLVHNRSTDFWNAIEKELDESGEESQSYNPESGAMIVGRIRNDSDKVAMVAATLNMI